MDKKERNKEAAHPKISDLEDFFSITVLIYPLMAEYGNYGINYC